MPTATTRTSIPVSASNSGNRRSKRPAFWVDVVEATVMKSPAPAAGIASTIRERRCRQPGNARRARGCVGSGEGIARQALSRGLERVRL